MSLTQFEWSLTGSTESPMILVLRFSNSGLSPAMYPSSVVHTGVKSFGCEKRIAHLSPIHSWKRIFPSVVSAVKSGASSPMRMGMFDLHHVGVSSWTLPFKTAILAPLARRANPVSLGLAADARRGGVSSGAEGKRSAQRCAHEDRTPRELWHAVAATPIDLLVPLALPLFRSAAEAVDGQCIQARSGG